jgi:hypothetical protein
MEFLRKVLRLGRPEKPSEAARGMEPIQSQVAQDITRTRMEAEMALQKERRDAAKTGD